MREHGINQLNNFISGYYLDDTSICDKIVEYQKNSPDKHQGKINNGVFSNVKKSTDVFLENDLLTEYLSKHLQPCVDEYIKQYEFCNYYAPFGVRENVIIQHYAPSEGFYGWHTERTYLKMPAVSRHLVFMTYLNDVTDGGQTEFFHQKLKIKPEKGLTLIWGADWTFTHRGITSEMQDKYIVTGWTNFID